MTTLDDFLALVKFYQAAAEFGDYYNPYDVENELLDILRPLKLSLDDYIKYEDIAYDTGLLFWSM
jgi:hypothetical protein